MKSQGKFNKGPRGKGGGKRPGGMRRFIRRKVCRFCVSKETHIDYKNANILRTFVSDRGKLLAGRVTGTCARHQRMLTVALKRARDIALIPYTAM